MKTEERKWHYQEDSDAYTHIVRDDTNRIICQLPQDSTGRAERRARLIAAAPAMYEALEQMVELCDIPEPYETILIEALEQAKAALATAQPETE